MTDAPYKSHYREAMGVLSSQSVAFLEGILSDAHSERFIVDVSGGEHALHNVRRAALYKAAEDLLTSKREEIEHVMGMYGSDVLVCDAHGTLKKDFVRTIHAGTLADSTVVIDGQEISGSREYSQNNSYAVFTVGERALGFTALTPAPEALADLYLATNE